MNNIELVVVDCLQVPKLLFKDERFKSMSVTAKVLYSILLDRLNLSVYNHWIDEQHRPYVVYSKHDMQKDLNCSKYAINQALKELTSKDDLVQVVSKNGIGNRFYLKNIGKEEEKQPMMTITEIIDTMNPEDRDEILDKIVRLSKEIVVDMGKMGYINLDAEPDQEEDPMEVRGYYQEDGNLNVEAIETDADDMGTELAFNCSILYSENVEGVLDMQTLFNFKHDEETDLELMSAVEAVAQITGGSPEYIEDMYACNEEARKIYLDQFIDSYNSVTDTIVESR